MKKQDIVKIYLTKIELIERYNEHYYNYSKPIVSDQKFDLLKKDILDLESKYQYLKDEKSPSKTIGFKPSKNFQKVKHKVPMLSLGNAFNEKDLNSFEKKIINFLSLKDKSIIEHNADT